MRGATSSERETWAKYRENPAFAKEVAWSRGASGRPWAGRFGMTPAERATLIPREKFASTSRRSSRARCSGMSIDLNTCIGCNACVIACQAENNVRSSARISDSREDHALDPARPHYSDGKADSSAFGGPGNTEIPEEPQISMQPVACMQCEACPCETVCPVNATGARRPRAERDGLQPVHRTRYCANNCPYKVRRFNFFDWNNAQLDSLYMGPLGPRDAGAHPDGEEPGVTIRMRGVMEKCT